MNNVEIKIKNKSKNIFYGILGTIIKSGETKTLEVPKWKYIRLLNYKELEISLIPNEPTDIDKMENEEIGTDILDNIEDGAEETFVCPKCGKEYQLEHYYNKHVEKCKG